MDEPNWQKRKRYLIHDRDLLFTVEFQSLVANVGVRAVRLPPQSPNLNAHAERIVRSIKESCLDRISLFGERSLRSATRDFTAHYHTERNHQGLQNRVIHPSQGDFEGTGPSLGESEWVAC
jgi:putative transposase